jgi:quercetin dioxygenase-like cupin family protein
MEVFTEAKYKKERVHIKSVKSRYYDMRDHFQKLRDMPRVIKGNRLQWGGGPQQWAKHLISPHHFEGTQSLHIHSIDLAPRAKSLKHGHQNEALVYILEGKGYEIHDGKTYEWNAGDLVLIHGGCVHQHFNADPNKPARGLIIKSKPLYIFLNLIYQAPIEGSPKEPVPGWEDYRPSNLRELL